MPRPEPKVFLHFTPPVVGSRTYHQGKWTALVTLGKEELVMEGEGHDQTSALIHLSLNLAQHKLEQEKNNAVDQG